MRLPVARLDPLANADRPNWLSAGLVRLLVLCAFIVLVEMLRPHLSPHSAGLIAIAGAVAVLAGAAVFVGAARRLSERLPFLSRSQRMADALALQLRRIGLPLLALLFFLFWTFVYLALWSIHFYYAVSTALISPPGDILAHSRGVRAATMIEMLTGFGVLTAYLSSFIDFGGERSAPP